MAFLEWRRFNFFNFKKDIDSGKIAEALGDNQVIAATSGNGNLVFGDNNGNIHLVNRLFEITSFRAYETSLVLAQQVQHSTYLFTVGEDEPGCNPTIKVWNLGKKDKQGYPLCVRVSRAIPSYKAVPASALCVHSSLSLMAIGFEDGSIMLYRGDVTRERKNKIRVLKDSSAVITGLDLKSSGKHSYLFVSTTNSVYLYNITVKDKEFKSSLDNMGCTKKCSILAESKQDSHFMIGRNDAIYCYTIDGRGPCYAVEGQKVMLEWFRSYLVIIARDSGTVQRGSASVAAKQSTPEPIPPGAEKHIVTVLDIQNKFIVFSATMFSVKAVLSEWGGFFILSGDNKLCHLDEKDLQSKLSLLFKRNLYDVAIRIAKHHNYDAEGLVDIFRQYGDHLYTKGDHNGAIDQYIKTIGKLEPSYVIRKFLDSQHIDHLTTYLQALHKQGRASENHTTLLLNCYTKLNHTEKLKEFIMTKDREVDFDVEIAIKVCRQASPEDALLLAQKHKKHEWYLRIQIEDKQQYKKALEYIATLDFDQAESNMKKYGSILLENVPNEATQFLKLLCTNYISSVPTNEMNNLNLRESSSDNRANPEDFIHLFLNNSEQLVEFLEHLVGTDSRWSTLVYNTLVEHYLHVWSSISDEMCKLQYEQKVVRLLQNSNACYDKDQILILCHQHNFRRGILYLYEERKLYREILQYHLRESDSEQVLATCNRFGRQDQNLWVYALWSVARNNNTPPKLLSDVLAHIAEEKLMAPLMVIDALSTSLTCTIGDVRKYLNNVLKQDQEQIKADTDLTEKYQADTAKLRKQIEEIKNSTIIFQGSRCSACHHQLELPSVHFMCQHSYHQHCFQSFSENENECPACLPNNKKWLDIIRVQEQSRDLHETFHSLLEKAEDPFSLVADYFSRDVFKKYSIITELSQAQQSIIHKNQETNFAFKNIMEKNISQGGEKSVPLPATSRLTKTRRDLDVISNTANVGLTINRKESLVATLESRNSNYSPKSSPRPKAIIPPKTLAISSSIGKDDYDETKNPFAEDDDDDDALNPFKDDYEDENFNKF